MASYSPDPGAMPGEDPQGPDQSTVDAVNSAVNQGYSYADVVAYHADNGLPSPPQPSLDAIMSGNTSDASQWQHAPAYADQASLPGPEEPLGHGGVPGDIVMGGIGGLGVGLAKGAAEGVAEGVLTDIAGAQANPIRSLVQTSAEELTPAMSKIDLAVERADQAMGSIPGKAAKWIAAGVGADLAGGPHRVGVHPEKGE